MRCLRCKGMTVEDWVCTEREGGISMVRCLNCGDITDNVIIFNRLHTLTKFHKNGRLYHNNRPRPQVLRSLMENIF
jgi:hypothetical protein